jgi:hypothetical protein
MWIVSTPVRIRGVCSTALAAFSSQDHKFLKCGAQGVIFETETSLCIDGPCASKSLEPIALVAIDGDICLCGVKLAEDENRQIRSTIRTGSPKA